MSQLSPPLCCAVHFPVLPCACVPLVWIYTETDRDEWKSELVAIANLNTVFRNVKRVCVLTLELQLLLGVWNIRLYFSILSKCLCDLSVLRLNTWSTKTANVFIFSFSHHLLSHESSLHVFGAQGSTVFIPNSVFFLWPVERCYIIMGTMEVRKGSLRLPLFIWILFCLINVISALCVFLWAFLIFMWVCVSVCVCVCVCECAWVCG